MAEEQSVSSSSSSYTPAAPAAPSAVGGVIIARAAKDYRWKRYLLFAILFGYGLWSIRDGFYRYPRENADYFRQFPEGTKPPHPGLDVQLNEALGVFLPPFSVLFLAWCLYTSRGEYRFDGNTLQVPGHVPIPLNSIRKIDKAKWDRKGIAYVEYQLPGTNTAGRVRIDDFIYERERTDRIFEHLDAAVNPAAPTS
jgi:hypothetical protein